MRIQHARISLELHELTQRDGPALLLLHALFRSSADWGELPRSWPGPVYALDFCGHGDSDRLAAAGYTPELLAGDADCALARIGCAALAGSGLGAYVALLLAGARPDLVPAALLLPGAGLSGGGAQPDFDAPRAGFIDFANAAQRTGSYDPMVAALGQDIRPVDYVEPFARNARRLFLTEDSVEQPPWWQAARRSPNAEAVSADRKRALARLAAAC
ncbi:MAG: alpha/beta fold hydrolase [Candidatus Binatia bacterium]